MLNEHEVNRRLADLRSRRKAALGAKSYDELNADEKSTLSNIDGQIGFCTEQLREHKAGAHFGSPRNGGLNFNALAGSQEREDNRGEKTVSNLLRSAFKNASAEEQEEIKELASYLKGRSIQAAANLTPGSDGGLLIPSFVQSVLERNYAAFSPVVNVCRLFGTDTGADTVFPVLSDSESAVQLDAAAATGADATVSGDTPPTELTGPTLKAYKISSKPVYIPRETQTDTDIDIVSEVIGALLARIIRFENLRYTRGTGVAQAQGFLSACSIFEHSSGTLDLDVAMDLAYSVPALYRPNGSFMASDATIKYLRKLKTGISGDKRQLWAFQDANAVDGTPALLHSYPIYVNNDMSDVASDGSFGGSYSSVLAFGDFRKFVVRQAENNSPYLYRYPVPAKDGSAVILFRRSDSKLLVPEAIAKLTVGTS
jgi:HK97 family phage major capsid protein